ncbi:two-component response regulator ORR21-like isoform X4 [Tripterygium wilfordii]|uniref:two-component response regulator ORR21-like isoform X4 n=1 Tax=Tripterygium wilfordii TaxID=458696 RepID=UPI0018F83F02|nr:two-component response regulator ORR21-like isoform X4 [Tripterygium wilfordii]
MVASMLGQLTFKVTTAETASTALAMIRDEKERSFDLVIADVYMKDMIFLKFMGMVLKRDIPVIVMTSSACVDVAQKMLAKGASFCCEKPISSGDLRYVWQHVYRRRSNPMLRLSCSSQGSNSRKEAEMNFGNKQQALFAASDQQVIAADPKGKKKLSELEALEHDIDPRNKNKQFEAETYLGPNVCSTNGQLKSCSQGEGFMRRRPIADQESRNKGRQIHSMLEVSNHEDEEDQLKDQRGNTSKKRKRAVWTRELHLKFTTALSLLGDKKATPKAILRLMKVPEFNQRQVASHLQKYKAQVQRIYEASTTTLQSACELKTGVREVSAEKNNSLAKEQSQRGLEVGGAKTHPSQELFGYNSRFPEGTLSFNERLKLASSYINAQNQNQLLFPIQGQNTMLGRNLTIADKYPRNLPEVNKELQTIETSAPPALDENEEMSYFADILKALEEDTLEEDMNKTANLAGQPDACDIDKFCEWLEKDTP